MKLLLVIAMTLTTLHAAPLFLYVAPNGNDAWSGRLDAPNAGATDGPFATLERARNAVRALKDGNGGLPAGGVIVELRGGTYERAVPFRLGAADSGTADAPVVYRARAGETVRIFGGRFLSGFQPVTDAAVLAQFDPAARAQVQWTDLKAQGITDYGATPHTGPELFVNGKPLTLARWPNAGFTTIVEMIGEPVKRDRSMTHPVGKWVYDGDRPARWLKEKDPWVHGYWFHDWAEERHRIKTIDPQAHTIEVAPPYHQYGYRKGKWYYACNLLSEIDQPGEWYLDRELGRLYLWPPVALTPNAAFISMVPNLVVLKDAAHVAFQGFVFEGNRDTALTVDGGEDCRVSGCTFRNLGGWAVRVKDGHGHRVSGCDLSDLGAGGIHLAGGDRQTLTPGGHVAENNQIHRYARIQRMYKPGIVLEGVGNRAAHNLIYDAPHMAMGFSGNDHTIEFNEIHSVCYESNDAGAIYSGRDWTFRGNVLRYNYLHHINGSEGRGCVGIYLDDSYSNAEIYGNLFYKVTRAAMIGGGRDNTIENNVFVECTPAVHVDARGIGWANPYILPNGGGWEMQKKLAALPYQTAPWTKYPHLANILDDEPYVPKYNVIARNLFVGGKWDGIGKDARPYVTLTDNLIDRDMRFVDAGNGNFDLRDDSPAFAIGFKRIPLKEIGLYADAQRASWPVRHEVRPMATPPPRSKATRAKVPVTTAVRTTAPITIDGDLQAPEWAGLDPQRAIVIGQGIDGEKVEPPSHAWLLRDDQYLYIGIRNRVDPKQPLRTEPNWGSNDAVEVAIRNPAMTGASIFVLRGYPLGQFESSTEAGAPFEVAQDMQRQGAYAAKVINPGEWTAEWRIPLALLGVVPGKPAKFAFNLSARKMADAQWLMWHGTGGATWQVDDAGLLELAP